MCIENKVRSEIIEHFGKYTIIKKGTDHYIYDNDKLQIIHHYKQEEKHKWIYKQKQIDYGGL